MTRPEKECFKFYIAISMVVLGFVLIIPVVLIGMFGEVGRSRADALIVTGVALVVLGMLWGGALEVEMIDLSMKWKRLGLGPIKTFPDTDYLRMAWVDWARDILRKLANEYTSAETAYINAKARVDEWHMPKPMRVVNAVGFEVAREEERKELARMSELKKCRDDAEKALQRIKRQYSDTWSLFGRMTIGNGKEMPKNMLPVHSDGNHWAHADAYRKHVAKGCPSLESPQEARVDQEGGDDLPI